MDENRLREVLLLRGSDVETGLTEATNSESFPRPVVLGLSRRHEESYPGEGSEL